jgi:hypothetical protein
MLKKEMNVFKNILKRLDANKKRLLKQDEKINKICSDYDKMLLTLVQR